MDGKKHEQSIYNIPTFNKDLWIFGKFHQNGEEINCFKMQLFFKEIVAHTATNYFGYRNNQELQFLVSITII